MSDSLPLNVAARERALRLESQRRIKDNTTMLLKREYQMKDDAKDELRQ